MAWLINNTLYDWCLTGPFSSHFLSLSNSNGSLCSGPWLSQDLHSTLWSQLLPLYFLMLISFLTCKSQFKCHRLREVLWVTSPKVVAIPQPLPIMSPCLICISALSIYECGCICIYYESHLTRDYQHIVPGIEQALWRKE